MDSIFEAGIAEVSQFFYMGETELARLFNANELKYCSSKNFPLQHLAARFAAKEAIIRAMMRVGKKYTFKDIEISLENNVLPRANILNETEYKVSVSLSHEKEKALAFVAVYK